MDGATETQQRWVVDSDGRHDGDSTVMDGNGRRERDVKAMDGLTAMDSNSTVMDGVAGRQWTARWLLDGNRARDSMIAMAMVMDCDHNGDGQQWTAMDGTTAPQRRWTARDGVNATLMDCDCNGDGRRRTAQWRLDGDGWCTATTMDGTTATQQRWESKDGATAT